MKKIKEKIMTAAMMVTITANKVLATATGTAKIPTSEEINQELKNSVSNGFNVGVSLLVIAGVAFFIIGIVTFTSSRNEGGDAEKSSDAKKKFFKSFGFFLGAALVQFWLRGLVYKLFGLG